MEEISLSYHSEGKLLPFICILLQLESVLIFIATLPLHDDHNC